MQAPGGADYYWDDKKWTWWLQNKQIEVIAATMATGYKLTDSLNYSVEIAEL